MTIFEVRYDRLGQLVHELVPESADKILLYAELEPGVILVSIFYGAEGEIYYVDPTNEIFDEMDRIQLLIGLEVRALEFELQSDNFRTHFTYADNFDSDASDLDRRDAVVIRHFGRVSR